MTLKTFNNSGRENYVSPSVEILDVMSEGVFCTSDTYDTANLYYNTENDLGEI